MKSTEFISPFSDFGFYHLFGKEGKSRENLIFLLNAILHDQLGFEKIVNISFQQTENKGESPNYKTTRYDIHCTTEKGHHIIVEMQNRWEENFDNRLLYYVAETIDRQGVHKFENKIWEYEIVPVVGIAMCNFTRTKFKQRPLAYYNLREVTTNEKYGDQINLVFVNIKEFTQDEYNCKSELEKIIYSLNNMETMQKNSHNPFSTAPGDFYDNLLTMSQYGSLTPDEQLEYTRARMHANDERLRIQRSRAEGVRQGKWEDAENFYKLGIDIETISKATGLPLEELKSKLK